MATDIKPIRTEADYEAALAEVEKLWGAKLGTPKGNRLDVLATLIDAYEEKHFPFEPNAKTIAAMKASRAGKGRRVGTVADLISFVIGVFPMLRFSIALILMTAQALAEPIVGRATVTDGDSIKIRNLPIRLEGIDAPEKKQSCKDGAGKVFDCGKLATKTLTDLIKGKEIKCEPAGVDRNKRTLALCSLPDGTEINAALVDAGIAFAFIEYSERYVENEAKAKAAKAGLWSGTFNYPWCFRDARQGKPCRSDDAFDVAGPLPGPKVEAGTTGNDKPAKGEAPLGLLKSQSGQFDCAPKYCKQMKSCKEARYHFTVCGEDNLDRDDDGVPCENVCPGG